MNADHLSVIIQSIIPAKVDTKTTTTTVDETTIKSIHPHFGPFSSSFPGQACYIIGPSPSQI